MKIGIIVYSKTGNTLTAAQKLEKALTDAGHEVILDRVEAVGEDPFPTGLTHAPEIAAYDAVVFASPVQAFGLAGAMKKYLNEISGLGGKKVYCFVTQQLKPWLGGNGAVRRIKALCRKKGAEIIDSCIINWSEDKRQTQIEDMVNRLDSIN